jgi:hypothetical protein
MRIYLRLRFVPKTASIVMIKNITTPGLSPSLRFFLFLKEHRSTFFFFFVISTALASIFLKFQISLSQNEFLRFLREIIGGHCNPDILFTSIAKDESIT